MATYIDVLVKDINYDWGCSDQQECSVQIKCIPRGSHKSCMHICIGVWSC